MLVLFWYLNFYTFLLLPKFTEKKKTPNISTYSSHLLENDCIYLQMTTYLNPHMILSFVNEKIISSFEKFRRVKQNSDW